MKHRLPCTVNLSILFTELPLLERPGAARAAGFDAVEYWWPYATAVPTDAEADAFVRAVRDAGVRLTGLNFFAGDMPAGDRGLVSWPARAAEFRDNINATVAIGEQLGCRSFNAPYGNRIDGIPPAEQDDLAVEHLALAARAAERVGGTVLLEPLDYCVQLSFDNINAPEVGGYGVDHVKVAEGLGCKAIRVFEPDRIAPALAEAKKLMAEHRVPVVVEVILERVTNVSMGTELDDITEFEELATRPGHAPAALRTALGLELS
ncbi:TIM barrel protein [Streptomyces sp. NPDC097640]|uniref:TIM barrel protein n=1 Tax=Streptomyces sp. NPDC097640 TaxID=3157229 RepID=UPI00332ADE96